MTTTNSYLVQAALDDAARRSLAHLSPLIVFALPTSAESHAESDDTSDGDEDSDA